MELEEWEYLSDKNPFNSQKIEENSYLNHEEDPHQEKCDVVPQIHLETTEVEFEEKEELKEENSELDVTRNLDSEEVEEEEEEDDNDMETKGKDCMNECNEKTFSWRGRGIGALGLAAATLSIIIFIGGCMSNHSRVLQAQIFADDKRIKNAGQQTTKLKNVLSALIGTKAPAANVSFGGP